MRMGVSFCLLLSATPSAFADDFGFAQGLAARGYFDLAESVFNSIINNPNLPAEKQAEGRLGLAQIKGTQAERERQRDPKRALQIADGAVAELNEFLRTYPNHPREMEVKAHMAYLHRLRARIQAGQARRDANRLEAAKEALHEAEQLYATVLAKLESTPEEAQTDEMKEKLVESLYGYSLALFAYGEVFADFSGEQKLVTEKLNQMIKLDEDKWLAYEDRFFYYDYAMYLGRAYQILAKMAPKEKAGDLWGRCFSYLRMPVSLMKTEDRNHPAVRDLGAWGILWMMRAHLSKGQLLGGSAQVDEARTAAKVPEENTLFKLYPSLRDEEVGKLVLIEQGRAWYQGGMIKEAEKLLNDLISKYKGTIWEFKALEVMTESAGSLTPDLLWKSAEAMVSRGRFMEAAHQYRRMVELVSKTDPSKAARAWLRMGDCYLQMERFLEAAQSYGQVLEGPLSSQAELAADAARKKFRVLSAMANRTKLPEFQQARDQYSRWALERYPAVFGEEVRLQQAGQLWDEALTLDGDKKRTEATTKWIEALAQYRQLTSWEPAPASIGFCLYRIGTNQYAEASQQKVDEERNRFEQDAGARYREALEHLQKYLSVVQGKSEVDPETVSHATRTAFAILRIATHPRIREPQTGLSATDGFYQKCPTADPWKTMDIANLRIQALLMQVTDEDLAPLKQAEDELVQLKEAFGRAKDQDRLGKGLLTVSRALMEAADKLKQKDENTAQTLESRGGVYFSEGIEYVDPERLKDPDMMMSVAKSLFKQAQRPGGAPEDFRKARALFERYLAQRPPAEVAESVRYHILQCIIGEGNIDSAIAKLEDALKFDPQYTRIWEYELLADCYVRKADATRGGDKDAYYQKADGIYARLAVNLERIPEKTDQVVKSYWENLYKHASALTKYNSDGAYEFFMQMNRRGVSPGWDGNPKGFQSKFKELRRRFQQEYSQKKLPEESGG